MIEISLSTKKFWENDAEGYIFLLNEKFEITGDLSEVENNFYPNLKDRLKKHSFAGKRGETFVLTGLRNDKITTFVFVGMGPGDNSWHKELEILRRSVGRTIKKLKSIEVKSFVLSFPDCKKYNTSCEEIAKQLAVVATMADYEFTKFKSEKKEEFNGAFTLVTDKESEELTAKLNEGIIIGRSINSIRDFADMPPNIATPTFIAEEAKKLVSKTKLKCTIFERDKAKELGMGGFLCVDSGSEQDGKFIVLEYGKKSDDKPTIALIGKGVTFDSGGISLKPANYMSGMKYDMSGAACVIGAIKAIAELKPNAHVVAVAPLVENMPSGRSSKQDDIITFMNGKTAEVKNTDAEGRLILADALCYAEKFFAPDVMIDVATLTGACVVALGHFYSALLTTDEKLSEELQKTGLLNGDKVWPLPLDEDYKKSIKSEISDIANCGNPAYGAGTITAGFFLSHFVEKAKWAHIDIAGTADGVPDIDYLGKGATGVGVRLLVDFVMSYKK